MRRLAARRICGELRRQRRPVELRRRRARAASAAASWCSATDDNEAVVLERLKVYHRQTEAARRVLPRAADVPVDRRRAAAGRGDGGDGRGGRPGGVGWRRAEGAAVIVCRSPAELEKMRAANQLVGADARASWRRWSRPGVTTADLDAAGGDDGCARRARSRRSRAITATRRRFARRSTSEVVHGIPSDRALLNEGDIVSIDMGAKLDGFFGDSARSRCRSGTCRTRAATLLRVTRGGARTRAIDAGEGRRPDLGHRPRGAAARRGARVFGGARVRRPRHRRRRCTRSRRSPTTASRAAGRGWPRAWCWRSSRW